MKRLFPAVFVALFMFSCVPAPHVDTSGRYDLRPNWKLGQTARYQYRTIRIHHVTEKYRRTIKVEDAKMVSEGEALWNVKEVRDDGSYVCTLTDIWKTIEVIYPDGKALRVDSRVSPDLSDERVVKFMSSIGVPLYVYVSSDGTITDVTGIDRLNERIPPRLRYGPERLWMFKRNAASMATLEGVPKAIGLDEIWDVQLTWPWFDPPYEGLMHYDAKYAISMIDERDGVTVAVIDARAEPVLTIDKSKLDDSHPPFDAELVNSSASIQVIYDLARRESVQRHTKQVVTVDYYIHYPRTTVERRLEQTIEGETTRVAEQ